jgi:glycosyltransferase involved in cell wall biosynthesis
MVSAYCLIARRAALLELGGLDANVFPGDFADADYCARAAAAGRRVIHLPVSGSFPPASSGPTDTRALLAFRSRHRNTRDPWLNPNLREDNARIKLVPRRVIRSKPSPFGALFFSHTLNMEGAPYSQYELATCLRRTGVVIPQVVAPSDGPLLALYRQNDIPVHIEPRLRPKYWAPSEVDLSVQVSRDLINATGASMVHANTLMTFTAIEAAYRTGCPSVWNPRESEPWNKFYRFLDRGQVSRALSCFQYPYRVVFVAQATLQLWSRFDTHHNFMVIRNGLDLSRLAEAEKQISKADARRSLSIGEDEILALSIGTVCARKGQRDIPAALGQLPTPMANRVKLLLVGDEPGPYSTALHRDIERLPNPWNSRISVVKTAQDVGRFYRAADLFLLNSRSESYPRVLLEAMAFELPIIATPVFGVREQVVEHVNGVFYPPGDTAALALRLRELVEDTHLLRELAANSRLVLSSLPTFEEMADQYATIFREAFYTK